MVKDLVQSGQMGSNGFTGRVAEQQQQRRSCKARVAFVGAAQAKGVGWANAGGEPVEVSSRFHGFLHDVAGVGARNRLQLP